MSINSTWRRWPSPSVTPNELLEILTVHNGGYYVLPTEPFDEVYPGIYVGDSTTALCLHLLKRLQVTHVLNTAWGKQRNLGMVNTSAGYYRSVNIQFMGIEALDMTVFPLFHYFFECADFIERALASNGKVLVHCGEGISRSSTTVIAFLMIKRGMDVKEAVRTVVKHRNILPNQGFLLQLCQLNDQLKTMAKCDRESPISPVNSMRESSVSPAIYSPRMRESSVSPAIYSPRMRESSVSPAIYSPRMRESSVSPVTYSPKMRSDGQNGLNVPSVSTRFASQSSSRLSPTSYLCENPPRRSRSPSPFRTKYQESLSMQTQPSRTLLSTSPVIRSHSLERSYPSSLNRYSYNCAPVMNSGYYRSSLMSSYLGSPRSSSLYR